MKDIVPIRRTLISLSDKTGIVPFAQFLSAQGVEILSTGGTAALLREHGIDITDVASYTGFPEMMQGRLKTLHPKIHGALLGRSPADTKIMAEYGIEPIDLLVINLYPFAKVIAQTQVTDEECIENIDIGGPAMIRSAAKNHGRVSVVVCQDDYALIQKAINESRGTSLALRRQLATRAFTHTASYDAMIATWMMKTETEMPSSLPMILNKAEDLRYGENPHQQAAFYHRQAKANSTLQQMQGKELSFNNLLDTETAAVCVNEFEVPACVIVKHANPCGAACAENVYAAYQQAFAADSRSAFGGIIALNRKLDANLAELIINQQFVEVIVAPEVDEQSLEVLKNKPSVRLMVGEFIPDSLDVRSTLGGFLVQQADQKRTDSSAWVVKTQRQPSDTELESLAFAWQMVKYVKSNAIVLAEKSVTVGIGSGQPNRVTSVKIATAQAEAIDKKDNLVMASDAFFPFRDSLDLAHNARVRAVVQPGGSRHDDEIIAAANEYGMAMVFTGIRHFRH